MVYMEETACGHLINIIRTEDFIWAVFLLITFQEG